MNSVVERIKAEISVHGVISFARFMELALYCPDCGYYEKENDRVGRRGDFYTNVSVGQLFGELLAFQFAEWLERLPGQRVHLVEAGAHDGRLAVDILTWIEKWRPKLFERLEYVVWESSDKRMQWQRETLKGRLSQVRWITGDLQVDQFDGVIFSNELLDALPVHRLGWNAKKRGWFEWGVVVAGDRFDWREMASGEALKTTSVAFQRLAELPESLLDAMPDGFTVEVCPTAEKWWSLAAVALRQGWLVTLDYGLGGDEFIVPQRTKGTLRAYHRHRLCENLLANAGDQDLTAHVNFDVIQAVGELAGLKTELFTTQANFLISIGKQFWQEAERQGLWTKERGREFQTLVHPEHLGRAFHVLVQRR